jgi:hypothetical protein
LAHLIMRLAVREYVSSNQNQPDATGMNRSRRQQVDGAQE